ncbi:MAG: hypothetical protein AAF548_18520 [Actinomycetota bacterium]
MAHKAIGAGTVLILLGVFVTIVSDSGSVTSLIPAFIGAVFVVLGMVARAKPELHHHIMHAAAALALLGVLGSLGSAIGRGSGGWALFAQLATVVVLGAFLQQAIMSFRAARRARMAAGE